MAAKISENVTISDHGLAYNEHKNSIFVSTITFLGLGNSATIFPKVISLPLLNSGTYI